MPLNVLRSIHSGILYLYGFKVSSGCKTLCLEQIFSSFMMIFLNSPHFSSENRRCKTCCGCMNFCLDLLSVSFDETQSLALNVSQLAYIAHQLLWRSTIRAAGKHLWFVYTSRTENPSGLIDGTFVLGNSYIFYDLRNEFCSFQCEGQKRRSWISLGNLIRRGCGCLCHTNGSFSKKQPRTEKGKTQTCAWARGWPVSLLVLEALLINEWRADKGPTLAAQIIPGSQLHDFLCPFFSQKLGSFSAPDGTNVKAFQIPEVFSEQRKWGMIWLKPRLKNPQRKSG